MYRDIRIQSRNKLYEIVNVNSGEMYNTIEYTVSSVFII
jgi:hypothetical protein